MVRLKLPRRLPASDVPAAAPVSFAPAPLAVLLGRREFLKAAGVLFAALAVPLTRAERVYARARGRFFTRQEFATLEALVDRILPPDRDPGAKAMGAANYIEGLLTAFDGSGAPRIFAGGPFSNRNPFPDNKAGRPSHRRPRNDFKQFIPLTRIQELRWRAEIFGSAAVPGANFNDAALGPLIGLRDVYRDGLAQLDMAAQAMAGASFTRLPNAKKDEVLVALDQLGILPVDPRRETTFLDVVIAHTLEGCLAPPEYGGNRHRRGWRLVGLEGDDQPLGYSIFSTDRNAYNERRRHPMSTANPDELDRKGNLVPRPLSADGVNIENAIVSFSAPFEDA